MSNSQPRLGLFIYLFSLLSLFDAFSGPAVDGFLLPSTSRRRYPTKHHDSSRTLLTRQVQRVMSATPAVGIAVIPGVDSNRPQKVNQDSFFCEQCADGSLLVGVLDGHGLKGHIVSQFIAEQLPTMMQQQLLSPSPYFEEQIRRLAGQREESMFRSKNLYEQAMIHAFHQVHHVATENATVPAGRSGTTCIACWIQEDSFHVAYVGDSRAVQFSSSQPTPRTVAIPTTTQEMPFELEMIESGEGRVDGNGNVWYGPVAIAMTRALGDACMLRAGVVPTPLTATFPRPTEGSSILVLATDGIWDVLSLEMVQELVENGVSEQKIAQTLADTARSLWIGDFVDEKADDITCLVVRI